MSISRSDLEKLIEKFPTVDVLEAYGVFPLKGINTYDSTQIYLNEHKLQALWLLKNSGIILEIINQYVGLRQYINDPVVAKEFPIIGEGCWIRPKRNNKCGWEKC